MGKAPHEPINSINEKLNTGIHCTEDRSMSVVALSNTYVANIDWLNPVPMNDTIIKSCKFNINDGMYFMKIKFQYHLAL